MKCVSIFFSTKSNVQDHYVNEMHGGGVCIIKTMTLFLDRPGYIPLHKITDVETIFITSFCTLLLSHGVSYDY